MKKLMLVIALILFPGQAMAQEAGFSALNPEFIENLNDEKIYHFYQGQTMVLSLDDFDSKYSQAPLEVFGEVYYFNADRLAFVGVSPFLEPGEYQACLFNWCQDSDRKNQLRIKVLKTDFVKSRIARFPGKPTPRRDRQQAAVHNAYEKSLGTPDLTDGLNYIHPLDIPVDINDHFGFIYENNDYRFHSGVDLRAKSGTPVKAVNKGKVVLAAKRFRREGNMIILSHGGGIFSVYMHLSRLGIVEVSQKLRNGRVKKSPRSLKEGDLVERGQVIGKTGTTGAGAGRDPHLHFNIRMRNSYVDPLNFITIVNKYLPEVLR